MTLNDLIKNIKDEITISGSLPLSINEDEIKRVITQAQMYFYDKYQYAVQKQSFVILKKQFNNPQFKNSRTLILPDCVVSVVKFQEINGIGRLGNIDRDFSEERLIASEIFLSAFMGDDMITRISQYQYFDLMKAFFLEQIAYDYNKNTHALKVEGRDPKYDVYIETWSKINDDKLYDDYLFIRYCTAQAKISFARLVGLYAYQLPGGVTINGDMYRSEGETEIEQIKERMKEEDQPDYIMIWH